MSVFQVIAQNLLGFDLIIFVAAALNGVCYCFARKNANALYRRLHMIVFVPSRRNDPESVSKAIRDVDEEQVVAMRKRSESLYAVFVNVTAVFPCWGSWARWCPCCPWWRTWRTCSRTFSPP